MQERMDISQVYAQNHMEKCVNLFDNYKARGGLMTMSEFHKQEDLEKRFKIPLSTFSRYATADKAKRLPTSSYTGPRSEKFNNQLYERYTDTPPLSELSEEELALRGRELDDEQEEREQEEIAESEYMRDDYFDGNDFSLTDCGPVDDPNLGKFELWSVYHRLQELEWWLTYYSYDADTRICREVRATKNRIVARYNGAKATGETKDLPEVFKLPQSTTRRVPQCSRYENSVSTWEELKMWDYRITMDVTGGGFHNQNTWFNPASWGSSWKDDIYHK